MSSHRFLYVRGVPMESGGVKSSRIRPAKKSARSAGGGERRREASSCTSRNLRNYEEIRSFGLHAVREHAHCGRVMCSSMPIYLKIPCARKPNVPIVLHNLREFVNRKCVTYLRKGVPPPTPAYPLQDIMRNGTWGPCVTLVGVGARA